MELKEAVRKARLYFVKNKVKSGSGYKEYKRALILLPMEVASFFNNLQDTEFSVFYGSSTIILTREEENIFRFLCKDILRDFREFISIVDVLFNEFTDSQLVKLSEKYPDKLEKLRLLKDKYMR